MLRGKYSLVLIALLHALAAWGDTVDSSSGSNPQNFGKDDSAAREWVAKKVKMVSQSLDMISGLYADSNPSPGNINANDLNSERSTSTFHSRVVATCLGWLNRAVCGHWLDEYNTAHAFVADSSPNEKAVGAQWSKSSQTEQGSGDSVQYANFQIKKRGNGSVLDRQRRLDWTKIQEISLDKASTEAAENVGYKTANRTVSLTFDENAKRSDPNKSAVNGESLRTMAQRWTTFFRSNLVAKAAEITAAQKGIEVVQDADISTCEKYAQMVQQQDSITRADQRLADQGLLDPETKRNSLQQRVALCRQAKAISATTVNPTVRGNQLAAGDAQTERADLRDVRVNLAMVDRTGIDANEVPSNKSYTMDEQAQERGEYDEGGINLKKVVETNAKTLKDFNAGVLDAAEGYSEVAAKSGGVIKDKKREIAAQTIPVAAMSMEKINGPTREMQQFLNGTSSQYSEETLAQNPEKDPSNAPAQSQSELVVRRAGP